MTIATTYSINATPGRQAEVEQALAEAKQLHESLGASVRIWRASFAGPNSGNVIYMSELADYHAFQEFVDKMSLHAPGPIARAVAAGSMTSNGASVLTEI